MTAETPLGQSEATLPGPDLILVVEDDLQLMRIEEYILESEGYRVASAYSGEEALEMLLELRSDLVLLDIGLPGIDGIATCRRIRETSEVPVIIVTGMTDRDDQQRALDAGANDYLTKPFSPGRLLDRVRAALRS